MKRRESVEFGIEMNDFRETLDKSRWKWKNALQTVNAEFYATPTSSRFDSSLLGWCGEFSMLILCSLATAEILLRSWFSEYWGAAHKRRHAFRGGRSIGDELLIRVETPSFVVTAFITAQKFNLIDFWTFSTKLKKKISFIISTVFLNTFNFTTSSALTKAIINFKEFAKTLSSKQVRFASFWIFYLKIIFLRGFYQTKKKPFWSSTEAQFENFWTKNLKVQKKVQSTTLWIFVNVNELFVFINLFS